eukprot:CAMPEP_0178897372 /NCGR_PEP_ID=MMETSP0786-20121207/1706_1 /TAXON_ID=186022 /ORGANISM="Thalassionema frauenfeldii, Strain CCMP 1798" /LENGTH=202 /DNA_ID=CAMNT_0020567907 /DNA_START=110 /DNA_END=715 /DNA_ORIENTATION=+
MAQICADGGDLKLAVDETVAAIGSVTDDTEEVLSALVVIDQNLDAAKGSSLKGSDNGGSGINELKEKRRLVEEDALTASTELLGLAEKLLEQDTDVSRISSKVDSDSSECSKKVQLVNYLEQSINGAKLELISIAEKQKNLATKTKYKNDITNGAEKILSTVNVGVGGGNEVAALFHKYCECDGGPPLHLIKFVKCSIFRSC